jgi:hypothetical protein
MMMLVACGSADKASSRPEPSLEEQAQQSLSTMPGVARVDARQTSVSTGTTDRADADSWSLDVDVVMSQQATADQVAATADSTHSFMTKRAGTARWTARLRVGDSRAVPDEDRTVPSLVEVDVYPTVRDSPAKDARDAMSLKAISGVGGVAMSDGSVLVRVADAEDLTTVIDQLRSRPIWKDGGDLQTDTGRVRVADVPDRITIEQLHAFLLAGVSYPDADFAIESSGQSPEAFVNRVTVDQGRSITASFTDPSLVKTGPDGFQLEFNIRSTDADHTRDIHGTFGAPVR